MRRTAFLCLLIGLWEIVARWWLPSWPTASQVGQVLWRNLQDAEFVWAVGGSLRRMVIGYALVVIIGVLVGIVLGRFQFFDEVLGTVAVAIHAIPGAAWVPLAIIWWGATEQAVIGTILLGATGIVIVSTDSGIRHVPPIILQAARTMGARGFNIFWHVVVPAAIPQITDGLRLAWAFGWRALMAGELLTSVDGLGRMLNEVARERALDHLLALMLLIAAIGMAVDGLVFKPLERHVRLKWGG